MMENPIDNADARSEQDELVRAALRTQPLAEPPPGLAAAVMQRLPARQVEQGWAWRAISLTVLIVGSLVSVALLALQRGLSALASPERLLRLQMEWWYWQQRAAVEWQARLGGWSLPELPAPEGVALGAAAVLVLFGGLGLLIAGLGGWLQVRAELAKRRIDL